MGRIPQLDLFVELMIGLTVLTVLDLLIELITTNKMKALLEFLDGKKTHLTAVLILALLFGSWQGWWKLPSEVYEALMAAGLIFLRLGVAKGKAEIAKAEILKSEDLTKP